MTHIFNDSSTNNRSYELLQNQRRSNGGKVLFLIKLNLECASVFPIPLGPLPKRIIFLKLFPYCTLSLPPKNVFQGYLPPPLIDTHQIRAVTAKLLVTLVIATQERASLPENYLFMVCWTRVVFISDSYR